MRRANGPLRKKTLEKDPKQWARESFELAKEKVYEARIRDKIVANDQDQIHSFRGVFVRLSADYEDRATKSASCGWCRAVIARPSS